MRDESLWLRFGAVPASFVVGACVTLQSQINGDLGHRVGEGPRAAMFASAISFGSGLTLLTLFLLVVPSWRRDLGELRASVRQGRVRRWQLLGGLAGALLVASQTLTVATIGVAIFVVAVVAGQTSSGLAVDHAGLGPSGRSPITPTRVLGALLAVAAVVTSSSHLLGAGTEAGAVLLALLPLCAGVGTAVQQAVNGRVAHASSPWVATWNNFVVGTTALLLALAVSTLFPGRITGLPHEAWLYAGGPIGVVFIATGALVVRVIGVFVFGLCSVAGQVVSAVVLDLITDPTHVTGVTYLGAALTLLGVTVTAVGQYRASRGARRERV